MKRRPTDALVRRCDYEIEIQDRRGRGRPKNTWKETLRKDLVYLVLMEEVTQNRSQWRSRIQTADPNWWDKALLLLLKKHSNNCDFACSRGQVSKCDFILKVC